MSVEWLNTSVHPRRGLLAVLAVAWMAAACGGGAGRTATTAGTTPTTSTVPAPPSTSPSVPTSTTTTPASDVFAGVPLNVPPAGPGGVPVVSCPTDRALTPPPTTTVPPTRPTALPAGTAAQLSFYSDDARSLSPLLAPRGWHCWVETGADGSGEIAVFPPSVASFRDDPGTYAGQAIEAVVALWLLACQGCVFGEVCSLIPVAVSQLGYGMATCKTKPPQEQEGWIRGGPHSTAVPTDDAVTFADPPGVAGTGLPSGGAYAANGVVLYRYSGLGGGQASTETCTLPMSQKTLCTTILNDFASRNWLIGS